MTPRDADPSSRPDLLATSRVDRPTAERHAATCRGCGNWFFAAELGDAHEASDSSDLADAAGRCAECRLTHEMARLAEHDALAERHSIDGERSP